MTILETIVAYKRQEVDERKGLIPLDMLEKSEFFGRSCYSFADNLHNSEKTGIIAEFKRASPSKGIINQWANAPEVTKGYVLHGASALSVLTDTRFFGGSSKDLQLARKANQIPILRKEFIIDEYQIIEAKSIGADAILLIAAILSADEIIHFTNIAHNLGLQVLLEVHDSKELDKVFEKVDMIGVNNRNLDTFKVDLEQSVQLAGLIPQHFTKITESGIRSIADIKYLKQFGYKGFLIGEAFMKHENPTEAFAEFVKGF
jgi:indole-3-glycerol phosphate synthase